MKKVFFSLVFLFSMVTMASITPMTSFEVGNYIGAGSWLTDDGSSGDYKSYLRLESHGWTTAQFRAGELYVYENVLEIDGNGFFTVTLTNASDPFNPQVYSGFGNCGTALCQLNVDIGIGTLQKAVYFDTANQKIYSFGAVYFNNGTPNVQWEDMSDRVRE